MRGLAFQALRIGGIEQPNSGEVAALSEVMDVVVKHQVMQHEMKAHMEQQPVVMKLQQMIGDGSITFEDIAAALRKSGK